jgi:hypothetical protein
MSGGAGEGGVGRDASVGGGAGRGAETLGDGAAEAGVAMSKGDPVARAVHAVSVAKSRARRMTLSLSTR